MSTKGDLLRKYAEVVDLCEGTGLDPVTAVKHNGRTCSTECDFRDSAKNYEFAIGIVEGVLVFQRDKVWHEGTCYTVLYQDVSKGDMLLRDHQVSRTVRVAAHNLSLSNRYLYKKGQPVMVRDRDSDPWTGSYFLEGNRTSVSSPWILKDTAHKGSSWNQIRALTPEELVNYEQLTNSWKVSDAAEPTKCWNCGVANGNK